MKKRYMSLREYEYEKEIYVFSVVVSTALKSLS